MKRRANILSQARAAFKPLVDIIAQNERSFIVANCSEYNDIAEVHSVRIGLYEIDFIYVTFEGEHHQHCVSFKDFEDWLDTLDKKLL